MYLEVNAMHTENLAEFIKSQNYPSSDVIIYQNHKELFRCTCGHRDAAKTQPLTGDELYFMYSSSKPMTCAVAMRLVERGIIGIDDPVSKYIPEYAHLTYKSNGEVKPCKSVMTIRHLFTMHGGLSYGTPDAWALRKTAPHLGTVDACREFVKTPLEFEPGARYEYSFCHDVLAAIVEIASGVSFGEYVKKNIFEPLEMTNSGYHVTPDMLPRFAEQYRFRNGIYEPIEKSCEFKLTDTYESGGAGLYSCMNDYIKFADAMACHGTAYNGYQVLKPETVELMRSNQNEVEIPTKPGYGYGFGVRTMICPAHASSNAPCMAEFGWDGAAGAFIAMDTYHKLSVLYLHHVKDHQQVYSVTHPVIRDSMYYVAGLIK